MDGIAVDVSVAGAAADVFADCLDAEEVDPEDLALDPDAFDPEGLAADPLSGGTMPHWP